MKSNKEPSPIAVVWEWAGAYHAKFYAAVLATNFINARVRINGPKFLLYNREFQRNFPLYKKIPTSNR